MLTSIVIATGNPHKVSELRAILAALALRSNTPRFPTLLSLAEAGSTGPEPAETGTTFEQNATIKALAYARQLNLPCLSDDSGLEVDALFGMPGVISSHYSSDGKEIGLTRPQRDLANNQRLLQDLAPFPAPERTARFVCAMVLALPTCEILLTAQGTFEGRIGIPPAVPAGTNGFGYDPLFLVAPHFQSTSAQLQEHEKNAISHRAVAARTLFTQLLSQNP